MNRTQKINLVIGAWGALGFYRGVQNEIHSARRHYTWTHDYPSAKNASLATKYKDFSFICATLKGMALTAVYFFPISAPVAACCEIGYIFEKIRYIFEKNS